MLTTLILAALLLSAEPAPAIDLTEANLELDAIAVMANPPQRQIVLSAILCDAQARARDIRETIEGGQLSRSLVRAEQSAVRDAERARQALGGVLALSCSEYATARLATCLDATAPFWCSTDVHLAPALLAAENLMRGWRMTRDAGADAPKEGSGR
jgi:hypothetical protein